MRHHSAFGTHFEPQRTTEDPLNPQLPAHCSTTLGSVQKEMRRTHHMMKLRFIDVSANSGSRLRAHGTRPNSRQWSGVAHDRIMAARIFVSIKRSRHRHHQGTTHHHQHRPDFQSRPLRLCTHSALSGVFAVLPRMSMHLISWNSIDFNRVLTHGFLNPRRFDGVA